jgi:hypothetical protein
MSCKFFFWIQLRGSLRSFPENGVASNKDAISKGIHRMDLPIYCHFLLHGKDR